jgi:hypothetical protein
MEKMPRVRKAGLIIKEADDEILIYDQESNRAHCLNTTASQVWKLCDGEMTIADACASLSDQLSTPIDESVVWYAINQFSRDNLIEAETALPVVLSNGMSRRQMVRTLGLAAVITLPLVTTMVAPTPAQAATLLPPGSACCTGAQCTSTICTGAVAPCTPPGNGVCA